MIAKAPSILLLAMLVAAGTPASARSLWIDEGGRGGKEARAVGNVDGERMRIVLSTGERDVRVMTPDAPESDAGVVGPGPGGEAVELGYRLRARVVVRAGNEGALSAALVGRAGAGKPVRVSEAGALAEFYTIDVATVREAATLASALAANPAIMHASVDASRPRGLRDAPTDPGFPLQWHLNNASNPAFSTGVLAAWNAGYTGTGVTVGIVEDGFNPEHPDIAANFNATASQPAAWIPGFIDHGTATAGLAAAIANNGKGGAGVAYNARVARHYIGFESENAAAFAFRNDLNFVKSNSWGPLDNATIAHMSAIEAAALADAATLGRAGKGTVIVWAAGNGAQSGDRVSYDPYASCRYAMAIGSIDNLDRRAVYSERGSSLLLVTTSSYDFSGSGGSGIYTSTGSATSGDGDYTAFFGGTSAAAPIASGVVALVLQANPNLTWRDVQHVLVRSARRCNPADPSWFQNGSGRWTSHDFGFGAIDAGAAVALAPTFAPRAPEVTVTSAAATPNVAIPDLNTTGVTSTITTPANLVIEHVEVVLNAPHTRLGDLRIELISPSGTVSVLAETRSDYSSGYANYTLSSVRCWGERAKGTWMLRVSDREQGNVGTLNSWQLRLHGARPNCPADWDNSSDGGAGTIDDLFLFLNDWFNGLADFDNSGGQTIDDLFLYLNAYFEPCL